MRPEAPLPPHAAETIGTFLRAHALGEGLDGVVVGLSGGIDSALVARLARDALGAEHVLGVLLPDAHVPAELVAETERAVRTPPRRAPPSWLPLSHRMSEQNISTVWSLDRRHSGGL